MFGLMTKAAHEAAVAELKNQLAQEALRARTSGRALSEKVEECRLLGEEYAALVAEKRIVDAKLARMTGNLCRGKVKPGSAQAVN